MGSNRYQHAHELFADIWNDLQATADEDADGIISEDEWVSYTDTQSKIYKICY